MTPMLQLFMIKIMLNALALQFKSFFEHCLKEIEHPDILEDWTRNLDEAAYK